MRRGVIPPGPILALLRSYGPVVGLVFGAYAEASPSVHTLLEATAEHEARALWETMGARGYQEARASVMQALYADWGMAAARAAARMRLERVRFVGLTRAQVHAASRSGGGRQRPEREEETVGHYAMVRDAFMRPAGGDAHARLGA